jgi:membrane carboxypeptidase/penicillin-binding protein
MLARFRRRSLWLVLAVLIGFILALVAGLAIWLLAGLPSLDDLHGYAAASSSKVYDRHGQLLFEMPPPYGGRHSPIPLDEMPGALRDAIIATEDASFYQNPGVDGWAIVRALWINLRGGEILSGGSTITQQLARNLLMSPDERYAQTLVARGGAGLADSQALFQG